jgi:hypothetical protein
VRPREYPDALRNPLKGFRPGLGAEHEWACLVKHYIRWNEIEAREADGVETIRAFCDRAWAGVEERNVKVVPRVYLHWPGRGKYWPADLAEDDYTSDAFQRRLIRLIEKLGEAWDRDGRVAFVEMGLIGTWGEHHSPAPTPDQQERMGDAFARSFRNKLVMQRYPEQFRRFRFGLYWDSFAHPGEVPRTVAALEAPPWTDRWKAAPMGGEMAFDWGTPLGANPTDAVVNHTDEIIAMVRRLHWNHLGWVSDYDAKNPKAAANARRIQKALGYRFVLDEVRYPRRIEAGRQFAVSFSVRNTGSSPFYYRWPVELSLLDPTTRKPVGKARSAARTFGRGIRRRPAAPRKDATRSTKGFCCPARSSAAATCSRSPCWTRRETFPAPGSRW